MSILNEGMGEPYDSQFIGELRQIADDRDIQTLNDAADRLELRSCQLNEAMHRLAVAAGWGERYGPFVDPEALITQVEEQLEHRRGPR